MESFAGSDEALPIDNGYGSTKPKIVVIMGPTGSGKSRLAIDLAEHFPVEIINADSMQVYKGLDILTNKVSISEQKGVKHHLLGTVSPTTEFTCKDFRDAAVPLINEIISRNNLPVIVGGTNFYIQALVSPFLLVDMTEIMQDGDGDSTDPSVVEQGMWKPDTVEDAAAADSYDCLKEIDPVAANRVHPNDHRKIKKYINIYRQFGVLPSRLFQERTAKDWGRVDNSMYECCFICTDASLPAIDRYVDERVDRMIEAGLLKEVHDVFTLGADYTRGLRQAIGVREFEDLLKAYLEVDEVDCPDNKSVSNSKNIGCDMMRGVLELDPDDPIRHLLEEGISNLKLNTRRLVRRQKRRIDRLEMLFGWRIHHVDSTKTLLGGCDDIWKAQVVEPSTEIIRSFLNNDGRTTTVSNICDSKVRVDDETKGATVLQKDLWTQFVCEACGNRVLRGLHEWEQHTHGRGHRKRVSSIRRRQKHDDNGDFLQGN